MQNTKLPKTTRWFSYHWYADTQGQVPVPHKRSALCGMHLYVSGPHKLIFEFRKCTAYNYTSIFFESSFSQVEE